MNVMTQLFGQHPRLEGDQPTNTGFAADFETIAPSRVKRHCNVSLRAAAYPGYISQEFAVYDHWFCSVRVLPGEPQFAHAATSDGEVDVHTRSYTNKTIFEQLSEANRIGQFTMGLSASDVGFHRLWASSKPNWLQRFKPIRNLYRAIQYDHLPDYAFIERICSVRFPTANTRYGREMDFRAGNG